MGKKKKQDNQAFFSEYSTQKTIFPKPDTFNSFEDNPSKDWHRMILAMGLEGVYQLMDTSIVRVDKPGINIQLSSSIKEEGNAY